MSIMGSQAAGGQQAAASVFAAVADLAAPVLCQLGWAVVGHDGIWDGIGDDATRLAGLSHGHQTLLSLLCTTWDGTTRQQIKQHNLPQLYINLLAAVIRAGAWRFLIS